MQTVKQWHKRIANCEILSTPQYTHLPCVNDYLRRVACTQFGLADVDPADITSNITTFCHTTRRASALRKKIELLEDDDA